jgi:hypothetical protein
VDKFKALAEGVTQDLAAFLLEDENLSVEAALDRVYNSVLFDKLSDRQTGLYRESSAYCYSLLKDELLNGKFVQAEV